MSMTSQKVFTYKTATLGNCNFSRNYILGQLPGTLAGATPWLLTNCSNLLDEPYIIVPTYTLSKCIDYQKLCSWPEWLLIQHHLMQMPG